MTKSNESAFNQIDLHMLQPLPPIKARICKILALSPQNAKPYTTCRSLSIKKPLPPEGSAPPQPAQLRGYPRSHRCIVLDQGYVGLQGAAPSQLLDAPQQEGRDVVALDPLGIRLL
jgi:hypothetical protein